MLPAEEIWRKAGALCKMCHATWQNSTKIAHRSYIWRSYHDVLVFVNDRISHSVYAVKAQTSLAPLSRFCGSRVTTAHAHQCWIFQSYAKTVPSWMKLTMKLTMREPTFMGSMTTDTWSRRVTSDFNSVLRNAIRFSYHLHNVWGGVMTHKVCSDGRRVVP